MLTPQKLYQVLIFTFFLYSLSTGRTFSGAVTVLSDPTESKVWIDGEYVGMTPVKNSILEVGTHSIRVLDEINQISKTKTVEIFRDSTTIIDIALDKEFGGIYVKTNPEGAEVVFTSSLGKTPLKDEKIIPGAYTVNINLPNSKYGGIQKEVIISPNSTIEINETLPKNSKLTPLQLGLRIGLGAVGAGCYFWGFNSMHASATEPDKLGSAQVGFAVGTTCLVALTTISIVF